MASDGDEKKEIYKPTHPLPAELQKMERDDTVCQFCGVSYLIHNEIKTLEEEIEKYKRKLKSYEGYDERQNKLKKILKDKEDELHKVKEETNKQIIKIDSLEKNLATSNELLRTSETQKTIINEQLLKSEKELHVRTKLTKKFQVSLMELSEELSGIKKMNSELKENYDGLQGTLRVDFMKANQKIKDLVLRYEQEKRSLMDSNNKAKQQFQEASDQLQKLQQNLLKAEKEIRAGNDKRRELETSLSKFEGNSKEITKLNSERDAMTDALTKMKSMLSERNRKLDSLESTMQEKERHEKEARIRNEKSIEKYSLDLAAARNQCEVYEQQLEIIKERNKNEKEAMTSTAIQVKVLKESLDASKKEIQTLKKERQDMIDAHQNRIKQLRESFNEKMSEANAWPTKLEERLTEQQLRFNEEKNEIWQQLNASFQKEAQQLNSRHEEEMKQLLDKDEEVKKKLKSQLETLQKRSREEIDNLKFSLSKEKERQSNIVESQESLIHNLEFKINQLEERLANTEKKSVVESGAYKQKYIAAEKAMETMKSRFNGIQKNLDEKDLEITNLQEIVRRECEERYELTEALSEARMRLLEGNKKLPSKQSVPPLSRDQMPLSSTERGRIDFQNKLKQKSKGDDSIGNSTVCNASRDVGISFASVKASLDETYNRKRIAEAVKKQRASSRASFEKLSR